MKTSHLLPIILMLAGDAAAFSRVAVFPRSTTKNTSSTTNHLSLQLFQHSLQNPKQELLNNRHSASDWFYNVRSLPQSMVLKEIRNPVLTVFAWACFVSIIQKVAINSKVNLLRIIGSKMCISGMAHSFLMSALGLLLVFRTNSAYQRFNEGRKIWEHILSTSRNLTRLIQLYTKEVGTERKSRIMRLVAAYPYLLRHHIRPGCLCDDKHGFVDPDHRLLLREPSLMAIETRHDGDKQCKGGTTDCDLIWRNGRNRECWVDRRKLPWCLFPEAALQKIAKARNRPLWVCDRIGREVMNIPYCENFSSRERLTMLGHVDKLTNAVGECERIHQTAVPLNYARHSLRSLTLWLFTLPFALVKDMGLLTGPVTACTAWLLFGVYQIGYSIEDPFQGSLRLSLLCDAIRRDVLEVSEAEGLTDDGRDSAYSLEASQVLEDSPDRSHLSTGATAKEVVAGLELNGSMSRQNQVLDWSGDKIIIDPNLLNPPQFIEQNGKILLTTVNGANETMHSDSSF